MKTRKNLSHDMLTIYKLRNDLGKTVRDCCKAFSFLHQNNYLLMETADGDDNDDDDDNNDDNDKIKLPHVR